ncbi:glutathione S-transferase [Aspergillus bertholletiae]|uniref:Glutathione S-transferase n=1 Tax=Aspergillus bertholletiae TaxID=1226010 RepID=A0A5N7APE0_9EURO|nr:glutathione S-transferase [Aspergillus bertholletiae]
MLTLYSYKESGNSYKVRLLASLLTIKLSIVEIDFLNDEQHSEKFLAINPKGEVPTLVDGSLVLADSAAILVYLAGKHSPNAWWSTDVAEQAQITEWLAFAASWVQYGVFTARAILSFGGAYNGIGTGGNEQTLQEAQTRGVKSLRILDQRLASNEWLALGRPTIADLAVFVYVALAPMGDISLEPFEFVKAWIARIEQLPGFVPIEGLDDPLYRRREGQK